jgi:hypothetical protein
MRLASGLLQKNTSAPLFSTTHQCTAGRLLDDGPDTAARRRCAGFGSFAICSPYLRLQHHQPCDVMSECVNVIAEIGGVGWDVSWAGRPGRRATAQNTAKRRLHTITSPKLKLSIYPYIDPRLREPLSQKKDSSPPPNSRHGDLIPSQDRALRGVHDPRARLGHRGRCGESRRASRVARAPPSQIHSSAAAPQLHARVISPPLPSLDTPPPSQTAPRKLLAGTSVPRFPLVEPAAFDLGGVQQSASPPHTPPLNAPPPTNPTQPHPTPKTSRPRPPALRSTRTRAAPRCRLRAPRSAPTRAAQSTWPPRAPRSAPTRTAWPSTRPPPHSRLARATRRWSTRGRRWLTRRLGRTSRWAGWAGSAGLRDRSLPSGLWFILVARQLTNKIRRQSSDATKCLRLFKARRSNAHRSPSPVWWSTQARPSGPAAAASDRRPVGCVVMLAFE